MKNPKMLSFTKMEFPNEKVARGARPVGAENLFFAKKKSQMTKNAQNF